MTTNCPCEGWQEYIDVINRYIIYASNRGVFSDFPCEARFKFCPWCGSKVEEVNNKKESENA